MQGKPLDNSTALDAIFAGNATITIRSTKPGKEKRFTYRVKMPKDQNKETGDTFWVSLMTGSDNESSYTYMGMVKVKNGVLNYYHGKNTKISIEASGYIYFHEAIRNLLLKTQTPFLEVWHSGKCCRCGRKLTDPTSIGRGIGPECSSIKSKNIRQFN